jgi:spermidine synthase
MSTEHAE